MNVNFILRAIIFIISKAGVIRLKSKVIIYSGGEK